MPTRRRSFTTSIFKIFAPSSRISPSRRVCRMVSCMRFRLRKKVDLPQPDGPISAVTAIRRNVQTDVVERLLRAVEKIQLADFEAQGLRCLLRILRFGGYGSLHGSHRGGCTGCSHTYSFNSSNSTATKDALRDINYARRNIYHQHQGQQHQSRRPMPAGANLRTAKSRSNKSSPAATRSADSSPGSRNDCRTR